MKWVNDDGGRKAAGFRGAASDCATRAIAIATGRPYREVYDALAALGKTERLTKRREQRSSPRKGVHRDTLRKYMEAEGWVWFPTMNIGQGCKVHLRADELPKGRLVVSLSKHFAAVIDGKLHDTHDSSRGGTRCVYGYFQARSLREEALRGPEPGPVPTSKTIISTAADERMDQIERNIGRLKDAFDEVVATLDEGVPDGSGWLKSRLKDLLWRDWETG